MSDQMPTARRYHWLSASWMNRPRPSVPTLVPRHWIWSQPSTGRSACHTLELQDVDSRCPPSGPRLGSDLRHARQHARWRRPRSIAAIRWKRWSDFEACEIDGTGHDI